MEKRDNLTLDVDLHAIERRAYKYLRAGSLDLTFPNYPTAGDVLGATRYRNLIVAYSARDPYPCNSDYTFGTKPFPRFNTPYGDGLEQTDQWNSEHVLDAQTVQAFWTSIINSRTIRIPRGVRTRYGRKPNPTVEQWIREFWNDRTYNNVSPMIELLSVYPGTHAYTSEITLLGGKINNKKQAVFASDAKSCIGSGWSIMFFWDRINTLNYCVHLSKVSIMRLDITN